MSERPRNLDYAGRRTPATRPLGFWFAWVSLALGLLNILWCFVAVNGEMRFRTPIVWPLMFGGLALSAPIGVASGAVSRFGPSRTRLGEVGIGINLPPLFAVAWHVRGLIG
jgi:hypothetical protein